MKKQRICIVGDGLAGLMTALALNDLPTLDVQIIAKKNKLKKDKRTTAISASNYKFFNRVLDKLDKRLFWPCLLYTSPSPRDRQKSRMPSSA